VQLTLLPNGQLHRGVAGLKCIRAFSANYLSLSQYQSLVFLVTGVAQQTTNPIYQSQSAILNFFWQSPKTHLPLAQMYVVLPSTLSFFFEILQEHCIAFKKEAGEVLQSCDYKITKRTHTH